MALIIRKTYDLNEYRPTEIWIRFLLNSDYKGQGTDYLKEEIKSAEEFFINESQKFFTLFGTYLENNSLDIWASIYGGNLTFQINCKELDLGTEDILDTLIGILITELGYIKW